MQSIKLKNNKYWDATGVYDSTLLKTQQEINANSADAYGTTTSTGGIVTFTAPAAGLPLKSLIVNIEPTQSGSGDPSPSNVRAITGKTAVNIVISPTRTASDGKTINITIPTEVGTVYDGTLDAVSGKLTINKYGKKIKDFSWSYSTAASRFESTPSPAVKRAVQNNILAAGLMCECYKSAAATGMPNECIGVLTSQKVIIKDNRYTTVSAFTAAMGEYMVVYSLAEPIVYQLNTPTVTTLNGTNNIWSNAGNVSITYGNYIGATNDHIDRVEAKMPSKPYKTSITLDTSWSGAGPYTHTVAISGYTVTSNSQVDLQPNATVISQMASDGVRALYVDNNNGTLTAYAVGAAPTATLTIQCTITEVDV